MKRKIYTAPLVNVVNVRVEKGFAISGDDGYAEPGLPGDLTEGDSYEL